MHQSRYYIEHLKMTKHPEGGYYSESYRHPSTCKDKEGNERPLSTSIYFLIEEEDASNFHRLKSDEIWYYHNGSPLTIVVITPEGLLETHVLGLDFEKNEKPQILVPAGSIFGSFVKEHFALVGCMVSPGFDFEDFELFDRQSLLKTYPEYESYIYKLTHQ